MNAVTCAATATCSSACGYACRTTHSAGNRCTVSPKKPRSSTMTFFAVRVRSKNCAGLGAAIGHSVARRRTGTKRESPPRPGAGARQNSSGRSQARMGTRLAERDCVGDQSQKRGQPEDRSSESSPLNGDRCCGWLSAQPRSSVTDHQAQDKNLLAGPKPAWATRLAERDCVGDQSQKRGQPEDRSSESSPSNGDRCCGWLSAQPRSSVTDHQAQDKNLLSGPRPE